MSMMSDLERYRRESEMKRMAEISERQRDQVISATEEIASGIGRMAAVADWALPSIVEHLALTAEKLGGIEQMLANPTQTAAAEFYGRGSYALSSDWVEEAASDLTRAVESYPYNPNSWFNLGLALERLGSSAKAAEAFGRCTRYGVQNSSVLAATAALLSASIWRRLNQEEKSAAILESGLPGLDRCAELHLALSVHHGHAQNLRRALELSPRLAWDARAAGALSLQEAARELCDSAQGPVARLSNLYESFNTLVRDAARLHTFTPENDLVLELPEDAVDALVATDRLLPLARHWADDLLERVRVALYALDQEAAVATSTHQETLERVHAGARAIEAMEAQILNEASQLAGRELEMPERDILTTEEKIRSAQKRLYQIWCEIDILDVLARLPHGNGEILAARRVEMLEPLKASDGHKWTFVRDKVVTTVQQRYDVNYRFDWGDAVFVKAALELLEDTRHQHAMCKEEISAMRQVCVEAGVTRKEVMSEALASLRSSQVKPLEERVDTLRDEAAVAQSRAHECMDAAHVGKQLVDRSTRRLEIALALALPDLIVPFSVPGLLLQNGE